MRLNRILTVIAFFVWVFGLAQTKVSITTTGNTITISGDHQLRYFADYEKYTVEVVGAVLNTETALVPEGVGIKQSNDSLVFELHRPFQVSLAQSEKTLFIVRGQALGVTPGQIGNDARAPVMYYLSNAEPDQVAATLKSLYPTIHVEIDDRQRALLIMMNPTDRTLIDALVQSLDAARPQVMFEAEILEINQSLTESLGIDYSTGLTLNLTEADPTSILSLGNVSRSPLSFKITLKALKNTGAANVLARPRVTTMDGVQAQLDATQTFPIKVVGASGEQSIQTITTGIVLSMTPKISVTGQVEAELNISVSTPTGTTSDGVPQFSTRKAQTTVRVNNGESIVIGGLFEKRSIEGQAKVPLLGDIPLLGALFSSSTTDFRQTDLVIIVTPRIVDMPDLQNSLAPEDTGNSSGGTP